MLRAGVLAPNPQLELLPTSRPPRCILIETGVLGMEHWTQTCAKSFSAVRAHCRATAKARPSSRLVRWNDFVLYCGSCAAHCAHGGCALPATPKLGRPSLGHDPGLRSVGSEHTTHGELLLFAPRRRRPTPRCLLGPRPTLAPATAASHQPVDAASDGAALVPLRQLEPLPTRP